MAISFADLHTEAGLKNLDKFLSGKTYISGDLITRDDVKVYAAVTGRPGDGFPNASRWYGTVSSALSVRFPGVSSGVKIEGQAAASASPSVSATEAEKARLKDPGQPGSEVCTFVRIFCAFLCLWTIKEEAPRAGDDDDDLDLFGDETEDEKKAAAEREALKPSKKKESGKSSVLLDVKPWDDETDMGKLEAAVRSVQKEGLLWGASKLIPVGYGIKKLQIMMTIVDDLVSVDDLIEDHLTAEPCNEFIQSCDIMAFNKI